MDTLICATVSLISTIQAFFLVLIHRELRKQNGRAPRA